MQGVRRLRSTDLAALPGGCGACLTWSAPNSVRGTDGDHHQTALERKRTWVEQVSLEWGSPGLVVESKDEIVASIGYAPARYLADLSKVSAATPPQDAIVVMSLTVSPEHRGRGLSKSLVHAMAADVVQHAKSDPSVRAIDAYGARGVTRPCLLPADFWLAMGFYERQSHLTTPRMRLELRSLATWRRDVEERMAGLIPGFGHGIRAKPTPKASLGNTTAPPTHQVR